MGTYADHLERACTEYQIPVFMDYKKSILLNAFVEYVRSVLSMVEQDFSYESVFRFLRSGLTDLSDGEIDELENYVLATRVRGFRKYDAPFAVMPELTGQKIWWR